MFQSVSAKTRVFHSVSASNVHGLHILIVFTVCVMYVRLLSFIEKYYLLFKYQFRFRIFLNMDIALVF